MYAYLVNHGGEHTGVTENGVQDITQSKSHFMFLKEYGHSFRPPYARSPNANASHTPEPTCRNEPPDISPTFQSPRGTSKPRARPKGFARRHDTPNRRAQEVRRRKHRVVAEPVQRRLLREVQAEEHDDRRDDQPAVERGARDVVVLQPPVGPAALDEVVEDGADDAPAATRGQQRIFRSAAGGGWGGYLQVNVCRRRGQESRAAPDQRHVDVPPNTPRVLPRKEPRDERRHSAQEPAPLQAAIESALGEESPGPDSAPDHAGSVEYLLVGTCVLVFLSVGARKKSVPALLQCKRGEGRGGNQKTSARNEKDGEDECLAYQTSRIFISAQFITAICTIPDQILATSCAANIVRGGTFI